MIYATRQLQQQVKKLQSKRDTANKAFLDALTYFRPFEEVKKLFHDLKAIEAELKRVKEKAEENQTV